MQIDYASLMVLDLKVNPRQRLAGAVKIVHAEDCVIIDHLIVSGAQRIFLQYTPLIVDAYRVMGS